MLTSKLNTPGFVACYATYDNVNALVIKYFGPNYEGGLKIVRTSHDETRDK